MIVVSDNIIPKKDQEEIKNLILTDSFPWYSGDLGLQHNFKHKVTIARQSNFTDLVLPIMREASKLGKFKYNVVDMASAFLKVPTSAEDSLPFIYTKEKHIVVQYFIHDAEGDLIIYDKKWSKGMKKQLPLPLSAIEKTITPKQGTAVIFTGHQYHTEENPRLNNRCTITLSAMMKDVLHEPSYSTRYK